MLLFQPGERFSEPELPLVPISAQAFVFETLSLHPCELAKVDRRPFLLFSFCVAFGGWKDGSATFECQPSAWILFMA